jgi:hypothetical protein
MAGKCADNTARIVRILVDCGMIAREELEIVRGMIVRAADAGKCARPAEEQERGGPGLEPSRPA